MASVTADKFKVDEVAPGMLAKLPELLSCHWYVIEVPMAETEKLVFEVSHTV